MTYDRSLTALGAAVILLACAEASHAGSGPPVVAVSAAPNPSLVNQTVTLTATLGGTGSCSVDFVDESNGDAPLCTATTTGPGRARCTASFGTAGVRTVRGTNSTPSCQASSVTYTHTVNAVAAPVPTVGEWTLWGLAGMILIGGTAVLARRARRFS